MSIIFSFLTVLYGFLCLLIVLLVLIQRGKGNMGLGNLGGNNQMLFGSSGGQDIFQKITWLCCFFLLAGSLVLAVSRGKYSRGTMHYRTSSPVTDESFPS